MEFEKLLVKITAILDELRIKYCITGGYAVSVWGRPRATFDIDVVIQLQIENMLVLIKSLKRFSKGGYIEQSAAEKAVLRGGEFNFVHPESGTKVDFWVVKENDEIGLNELKRRVPKDINGQKIYFISPEDLILSKLRWFKEGRSNRHLEDAESVIKFSGKKLNKKYLRTWSAKQKTDEISESLLR